MFLFLSCKGDGNIEKRESGYTEVQAVIYEAEEYIYFFQRRWRIKYVYNYQGKTYKGSKGSFTFPLSIGQPVVVEINENEPENSHYSKYGLLKK